MSQNDKLKGIFEYLNECGQTDYNPIDHIPPATLENFLDPEFYLTIFRLRSHKIFKEASYNFMIKMGEGLSMDEAWIETHLLLLEMARSHVWYTNVLCFVEKWRKEKT